jgi:hypothetical protein
MIIILKKNYLKKKKKQIVDGFGQNRPEFSGRFFSNRPESVMDGLVQTVWNCRQFDPNRP